jgi:hypothetical protein
MNSPFALPPLDEARGGMSPFHAFAENLKCVPFWQHTVMNTAWWRFILSGVLIDRAEAAGIEAAHRYAILHLAFGVALLATAAIYARAPSGPVSERRLALGNEQAFGNFGRISASAVRRGQKG